MPEKNKNRTQRLFPKTVNGFVDAMESLEICDSIRWNAFTESPIILSETGAISPVTDATLAEIKAEIEERYKIYNQERFNEAWRIFCADAKRSYHPIKQRIENAKWDGKPHITKVLQKILKCDESPYTKECARLLFSGGLRRLYEPGCKFDSVIVLIGTQQGEGKSTFLRWLAMEDDWYGTLKTFDYQRGAEALSGKWIVEIEELSALKKSEVEEVKAFISQQRDHYRRPYERTTSDIPRKCVMAGTTNSMQFLSDPTGNRRFLPIEVHSRGETEIYPNEKEIRAELEQCWAEAYALYRANDEFMLPTPDRDLTDRIISEQERATVNDPNLDIVKSFLESRTATCVLEIYYDAFGHSTADHPSKPERNEIGVLLQRCGWRRDGSRIQYTKPIVHRPAKWVPADAVDEN